MNTSATDIQNGQEYKIYVHGWVMLAKVDAGPYFITVKNDVVYFHKRRPKPGAKASAAHWLKNVDFWIKPEGKQNNFIELLSE